MNKYFQKFRIYDLVIIALIASISIASKSIFVLLGELLAGNILPAGTFSGIIYMVWIVLPILIVKKRGTGILVGVLQALLALVFGMLGNRGLLNIPVYIFPCIIMEIVMLFFTDYVSGWKTSLLAGAVTNMSGAFIVGAIYFQFSLMPLLISLSVAFITGGLGGIVAYKLYKLIFRSEKERVQMNSVSVENLSFSYAGEKEKVFDDISFFIKTGECLKLEGCNGSGKSTLANCLCGIIPNYYKGELFGNILINGETINDMSLQDLSDKIGIISKNPEVQLLMPTVEDELAFPLENRGIDVNIIHQKIIQISSLLKIKHLLKRNINNLSLGEKQLIVLAAVLIVKPSILILDEAFSMLDKCNTRRFINILSLLKKEKETLIIIDHINKCESVVDRTICLEKGKLVQKKG